MVMPFNFITWRRNWWRLCFSYRLFVCLLVSIIIRKGMDRKFHECEQQQIITFLGGWSRRNIVLCRWPILPLDRLTGIFHVIDWATNCCWDFTWYMLYTSNNFVVNTKRKGAMLSEKMKLCITLLLNYNNSVLHILLIVHVNVFVATEIFFLLKVNLKPMKLWN